jgi:RNA polymerase sigma-70 factor, ECF subfamily
MQTGGGRLREVIERAKDGDADAFTSAVATSVDQLYAAAYLVLRDHHAAEDAVQDGLLRAWRHMPSLRDPDRFDAWLRRIVFRAAVDASRRRRPAVELATELADPVDAGDGLVTRDLLERAFARLEPIQRAILVLRYYVDLSVPEIARTLDVPDGTAKSRLHHAMNAMRSAIAETNPADEGGIGHDR